MCLAIAQVAELVDALASGASGLTAVKVRVLSWAPVAPTPAINFTQIAPPAPAASPLARRDVAARGCDRYAPAAARPRAGSEPGWRRDRRRPPPCRSGTARA